MKWNESADEENAKYTAMVEKYEPADPVEPILFRHKRQTYLGGRGADGHNTCDGCGAIPPEPDLDGMFFILENHSGQRIVFAHEEGTSERTDCYPVTGWREIDHKLYCGACAAEVESTIRALRHRRKR